MDNTEFKTELLKIAGDLRDIAQELKAQPAKEEEPEKTASETSPDFSLGAVGGAKRSNDPLMDFIFS